MRQARGGIVSWSRNNLEHAIALHNHALQPPRRPRLLHTPQRLNNPATPKQAVFETIPRSQTRNEIEASPLSCPSPNPPNPGSDNCPPAFQSRILLPILPRPLHHPGCTLFSPSRAPNNCPTKSVVPKPAAMTPGTGPLERTCPSSKLLSCMRVSSLPGTTRIQV